MFSSKPHVAVITRGLFFSIRYSILLYNFPYSREVGYIIIKTVITKRSFEAPTYQSYHNQEFYRWERDFLGIGKSASFITHQHIS